MTSSKLPTRRNLIAAVALGGLILWQLGAFDPRARAPSRAEKGTDTIRAEIHCKDSA